MYICIFIYIFICLPTHGLYDCPSSALARMCAIRSDRYCLLVDGPMGLMPRLSRQVAPLTAAPASVGGAAPGIQLCRLCFRRGHRLLVRPLQVVRPAFRRHRGRAEGQRAPCRRPGLCRSLPLPCCGAPPTPPGTATAPPPAGARPAGTETPRHTHLGPTFPTGSHRSLQPEPAPAARLGQGPLLAPAPPAPPTGAPRGCLAPTEASASAFLLVRSQTIS